jgi:hypothetical protein
MSYEVAVYNQDGNILGSFLAHKLAQASAPGVACTLQVFTGVYRNSGEVFSVKVYKDENLYAQWTVPHVYSIYAGSNETDSQVTIWYDYLVDRPAAVVCTCGGWAVYGKEADIHADDRVNVCDLRK